MSSLVFARNSVIGLFRFSRLSADSSASGEAKSLRGPREKEREREREKFSRADSLAEILSRRRENRSVRIGARGR